MELEWTDQTQLLEVKYGGVIIGPKFLTLEI